MPYANAERDRFRYRVRELTRRLARTTKTVVAVGGLVLVVALQVPWLQGILTKIGVDEPTQVGQVLIVALLVAIFSDLRSLLGEERVGQTEPAYFSDPMDVYPVLLNKVLDVKRPEEKKLDVIGMTLYTAWPSIQFWLRRRELTGWTITMTAVSQVGQRTNPEVPPQWYRDAAANLESIRQAADEAKNADNTLHAFGYSFTPAIHGFRLGNGDLFWSALRWEPDGKVSMSGYSYEFVPGNDRSPGAEAKRAVFDSWLTRSREVPIQ